MSRYRVECWECGLDIVVEKDGSPTVCPQCHSMEISVDLIEDQALEGNCKNEKTK